MSAPIRLLLLAGLAVCAAAAPALAQTRTALADPDADRLFQDQNGAYYLKRGDRYVPYSGRVEFGRAVLDRQAAAAVPALAPAPAPAIQPPASRQAALVQPEASGDPALSPIEAAKAKAVLRTPDNGPIDYAKAYGPIEDDVYPVRAFDYKKMSPAYLRQEIAYNGPYEPGTIIVDPRAHQLTLVQEGGRARRYGVGVGKQGFSWSGTATVNSKQAWPDWYPPKEMIARSPKLASEVDKLQSGLGVSGGLRNPLGARAMYLWQGNKDTLFRIHGTLEPFSIGKSVSSGCIRMINQDAIDLFSRVNVGSKVVVLN